jgi:hypothetical protein
MDEKEEAGNVDSEHECVSMRQNRNCEDNEAETYNRNGEEKLMQLNKG